MRVLLVLGLGLSGVGCGSNSTTGTSVDVLYSPFAVLKSDGRISIPSSHQALAGGGWFLTKKDCEAFTKKQPPKADRMLKGEEPAYWVCLRVPPTFHS